MPKSTSAKSEDGVTLFDAKERFYVCRIILDEQAKKLDEISQKRHPGVIDLMQQFSLLRSICMKTAQKVENQDPANDDLPLKPRALHLIESFEYLVYDFREILKEAHNELAD